MSLRGLALVVATIGLASPAMATELPRIASTGLCADQFVMMLADRSQIASVSSQANGPLSAYAAQTRGLATNRGAAEEMLAQDVDLVITSGDMNPRSSQTLARLGVEVVTIPFANTFDEIEAATRLVADKIGRKARGEQVIADMRARLSRVRPAGPQNRWPMAAYYRPDGGSAGMNTFVDVALHNAGYRNLQAQRQVTGWGTLPAEAIVTSPPDLFVVSYFDSNRNSTSILRRNPIVWNSARTVPVVTVPGKYWNCGSPLLVDAVEFLARERNRLFPTSSYSRVSP